MVATSSGNRDMPIRRLRVLVLASAAKASQRRIIDGIGRFASQNPHWDVELNAWEFREFSSIYYSMRSVDGILLDPTLGSDPELLKTLRCPIVCFDTGFGDLPVVVPDEAAIAALVYKAFREIGLTHFAFCGVNYEFSNARERAFVELAAADGFEVLSCPTTMEHDVLNHPRTAAATRQWVSQIRFPCGVFAATTLLAHTAMHLLREFGTHVPDQVALLGVDDDDLYFEITRPRLSMVDQAADVIGFQAAKLLNQLMLGQEPKQRKIVVAPRGIIQHESTDMIYTESGWLVAAIRHIRQHAVDGVSVSDVVNHVAIGRRRLEMLFRKELGRTIHDEIIRSRLRHAKHLMASTNESISTIAARCGFHSASKFCRVFKQREGLTSTEFKKQAER